MVKDLQYGVEMLFSIISTVLKHGGQEDVSGKLFNMKIPTKEKFIVGFVKNFSGFVCDTRVKALD